MHLSWLFIGIFGLIFVGIASTGDKVILKKAITDPIANAFFVSLTGLFALVLVPFGFHLPTSELVIQSLGTGILFFLGMLFYFFALKGADASAILPIQGGWLPVAALGFSALFIPHTIIGIHLPAFMLMVLGTVMISKNGPHQRLAPRVLVAAFASAIFIGASDVLTKKIFLETGFISGFVLTRVGAGFGALIIFSVSSWRARIFSRPSAPAGAAFLGNRLLAGFGSVIFFYAISLGNPPILEALRGVSLLTVFVLTALCSRYAPRVLHESFTRASIVRKLAGTACIVIAIALL